MEVLLKHEWPGNIRELENVMERACVTTHGNTIQSENLPPDLSTPVTPKMPFQIDLSRPLPDLVRETVSNLERQYIQKALRKTRGHVGRCAKICCLSRRSITTKIAEYGLDRSAFHE
jgi:DNA-binding NtrC family response regulator